MVLSPQRRNPNVNLNILQISQVWTGLNVKTGCYLDNAHNGQTDTSLSLLSAIDVEGQVRRG